MKMRALMLFAMLALALSGQSHAAAPDETAAHAWVQQNLPGWPQVSRKLAVQLIIRYGQPQDTTSRALIWYDNGPWKRTVLHRTEAQHNFPAPHKDVLEQTVSYRVPPEKLGDVVQYNGSVTVNRTRGEITAFCDSETQNIIALNLVNDIVAGNRNLELARVYHAQLVRGIQTGDVDSYATRLQFQDTKSPATGDPAEMAPLLRHMQSE